MDWPKKAATLLLATKMVVPKSLKSMKSGSEKKGSAQVSGAEKARKTVEQKLRPGAAPPIRDGKDLELREAS